MRLHKHCYLGFRRGPDTWIARFTHKGSVGPKKYKYEYKTLDARDYDSAKSLAETWFARMGSALAKVIVRGSVRDALEAYCSYLTDQGRVDTAENARDRFRLIVWNDPIAIIALEDLSRHEFREWRSRLQENRKNRSVNRHVRSVVAGLNLAVSEGHSGNPDAWKIKPLADIDAGACESTLFLTPSQRQAIIDQARPNASLFLRAIQLTGARPGELAAATVADFDSKAGTVILRHKKGRPAKLRPRAVVLADDGVAFFKKQTRNRMPSVPLLIDQDSEPWGRHRWADEVQAAIRKVNTTAKGKARIPVGASAYSFRHARISELLQDYGVDPITVAQQTGTSTRMIEQTYFKFIAPSLRKKLSVIGSSE